MEAIQFHRLNGGNLDAGAEYVRRPAIINTGYRLVAPALLTVHKVPPVFRTGIFLNTPSDVALGS
jgi:hypothetical protein